VDMASSSVIEQTKPSDGASARFLRFVTSGDTTILDALLAEHLDRSYTQARRLLGNDSSAEDAVQEAYVQLVRTSSRYDGSIPFAAWLGRLVHGASLHVMRSSGRRSRHERVARERAPQSTALGESTEEESSAVRDAVRELPERYRSTVDLHYFAGLSQRDTAKALGLSEDAVAMRLHRAREFLRSLLARRGVALGGGAILIALGSTPSYAAPATLAASSTQLISALAAGSAIPKTTLSVGIGIGKLSVAATVAVAVAGSGMLLFAKLREPQQPAAPANGQIAHWDFSEGLPADLTVIAGKFIPSRLADGDGFVEPTRSTDVIAAYPQRLEPRPVSIDIKAFFVPALQEGETCTVNHIYVAGSGSVKPVRMWVAKTRLTEPGGSITSQTIVSGKYLIHIVNGIRTRVMEFDREYPASRLCLLTDNFSVSDIRISYLRSDELPEWLPRIGQIVQEPGWDERPPWAPELTEEQVRQIR
jgi:RNA polymerase sigma factor (sigma-70 family)